MAPEHDELVRRVLRGWKEIADYLRCSPRSAQRYARDAGLPVHRPGSRASVWAFADELTEWVRRRPLRRGIERVGNGFVTGPGDTGPSRAPGPAIALLVRRHLSALRVAVYDGDAARRGLDHLLLGVATLPPAEFGAPPVRLTLPGGFLELAWMPN